MSNFETHASESFETLKNPPIIEAVVEIRCAAEKTWEEEAVTAQLRVYISGYDFLDSRFGILSRIEFHDGEASAPPIRKDWVGARFRSTDKKYVASFSNDSFACSRLEPYETWEKFKEEALRMWDVHVRVAEPSGLDRLNLRYINRIPLSSSNPSLEDQLRFIPYSPDINELEVYTFLHKDTFIDKSRSFITNRTVALQRNDDSSEQELSLILDINISTPLTTNTQLPLDNELISNSLDEMRVLKNRAFFGTITDTLRQRFNGE